MYRVLIVDDEEPVLESYAFLLETAGPAFLLAGKARSGYEAIRLIHELKPDVVFMDINIPGMDGIEVIASVHQKYPGAVFVLSTAYERFDLAQRAIPLGVFDYLVKPVSKKTFLDTLDAIADTLGRRDPFSPGRDAELQERLFLKEAIWKEMSGEEWGRYRDLFSFHSDKGLVCLVELEEDNEVLYRQIASKLSFKYRCLFSTHLGRGLYFIPADVDLPSFSSYLERVIGESIPDSVFRAFSVGSVHGGCELYRSCEEALSELRRKRDYADVRLRERLRVAQIRRKMGIAGIEEVRAIFVSLWEEVFASYDFNLAKTKMATFFAFFLDDATGCFSGGSEEAPPMDVVEEIVAIADEPGWAEWSLQAFNKLYRLLELKRSGDFPLPLVKALEYVGEHYSEPLQQSAVADAAMVSSAYLSRLFSEHLHTTFVDYVTELRVERAEKLIRESRMSIKEVAFQVGYQDPNYFSKIFRKVTGLPPTMYAAENRAENSGMMERECQ